MAVEVYEFAMTIPAGTAKSAGFSLPMAMPVRQVDEIEVRVPPGPRGEMGFGIGASQTIVLPQGGQTYFVMDDQFRSFTLDNAITSGAWVFFGYNVGTFDHTVYITFHVSLPYSQSPTAGGNGAVDVGTLNGGGTVPAGGEGGGGGTETPPPVEPPPVEPPPVTPPDEGQPPISIPPSLPAAPGQPGPSISPMVDELIVGVSGSGTAWLLDDRGYSQIASQDDLTALLDAGVSTVSLSQATHEQLLKAAGSAVTLTLGSHVLSGTLVVTRGVASHQITAGM